METEEFKKLKRFFIKIKEMEDYHYNEVCANRDGKESEGDLKELCSYNFYYSLGHKKAYEFVRSLIYRFYPVTDEEKENLNNGKWPEK